MDEEMREEDRRMRGVMREAGRKKRRGEENPMSLRKTAKILGMSHTYLSLLLNGKRSWRRHLKERYLELVNTFVNGNGSLQEVPSSTNTHTDYLPSATFQLWREREGVEPPVDTVGCPPTDLKSAKPTRAHPLPFWEFQSS